MLLEIRETGAATRLLVMVGGEIGERRGLEVLVGGGGDGEVLGCHHVAVTLVQERVSSEVT